VEASLNLEAVGVAGGWRDRGAGVTAGVTAGRDRGAVIRWL